MSMETLKLYYKVPCNSPGFLAPSHVLLLMLASLMSHKQLIKDPFGLYLTLRPHTSLQSNAMLHICKCTLVCPIQQNNYFVAKICDTRVQPYMEGVFVLKTYRTSNIGTSIRENS